MSVLTGKLLLLNASLAFILKEAHCALSVQQALNAQRITLCLSPAFLAFTALLELQYAQSVMPANSVLILARYQQHALLGKHR